MQKIFALLLASAIAVVAGAQNTISITIKDQASKKAMAGVSISLQYNNSSTLSDQQGSAVFTNIPYGKHTISFSYAGYKNIVEVFDHQAAQAGPLQVFMETEEEDLDEVIVQSTRTSRTIKNSPTRVETIDGEELDEKNNMRPGNVSMLLHESTGMQVQQTSATSGNASIRVQGLDGKYTQLLKDGYPNFGNFASGLSVLEIPPLDLRQVEVIKGPASTLYGGGAIAGVVNFISKMPKEKFEGDFILNRSHIGQTNIGGYISQKKRKLGYALLVQANFQKAYDVDKDEFSEVPESKSFTIDPRLFFYPDSSTSFMLGNSFTSGNNMGGDMEVINGKPDAAHTYFEKNRTLRNTTTLEFSKKTGRGNSIRLKQSLGIFHRHIDIPDYSFSGLNTNSFTDLSLTVSKKKHTVIGGLNLVYDRFNDENAGLQRMRSFTTGGYFQDTWDISEKFKIESGLRFDQVRYRNINFSKAQSFLLPRVSALFRFTEKISSRIGGGLGYKIPTLFTEQTESMQYKNVLPLSQVTAEKSIGGTADINYKTRIGGDLTFSINQMFFYTSITKPLVLQADNFGNHSFVNAAKPITSRGFETNLKFIFREDLKFFLGYTHTDARAGYLPGNKVLPLLPRNKLNLTLMYEKEDNFKLGLEGYFTDRQYLYNASRTPSFWEFGFMAQKTFKKISAFINFENFTDQRQSRYKAVVNPPHTNPGFDDIWNHTEGFVVNGGIKLKL